MHGWVRTREEIPEHLGSVVCSPGSSRVFWSSVRLGSLVGCELFFFFVCAPVRLFNWAYARLFVCLSVCLVVSPSGCSSVRPFAISSSCLPTCLVLVRVWARVNIVRLLTGAFAAGNMCETRVFTYGNIFFFVFVVAIRL